MGLGSFIKKAVGIAGTVAGASGNPWIAAAGNGIAGLMSADAQNSASARAAAAANAFTKEQLQKRHQWEVQDLKKAGLNPVLSAGGTPSIGGSSTAQVVGNADSMAKAADAAASSKQIQRMDAEIQNLYEQNKNISEDTALKKSNMDVNKAVQIAQMAQAQAALSQAGLNAASARDINNRAQISAADANRAKALEWLYSTKMGLGSAAFGEIIKNISGFGSSAKDFVPKGSNSTVNHIYSKGK